jgi:hypothetical protein
MADPPKPEGPGNFEITASDGSVYHIIGATEEQVNDITKEIETQVAKGNRQLDNVKMPHDAIVQPNAPQGWGDTKLESDHAVHPNALMTFLTQGVGGATANWGDEIAAAGNAAIPGLAALENFGNQYVNPTAPTQTYGGFSDFWNAFHKNLQGEGAVLKAGQELHPTAAAAGTIAGALTGAKAVGSIGSGAINAAAKIAPKMVIPAIGAFEANAAANPIRAAMGVATVPAVAGGYVAGYGGGDTPENRARGGGQGAMAGAILGPTLGVVTAKVLPEMQRMWAAFRNQGSEEEALHQMVGTLQRDGYDVTSPDGILNLKNTLSQFSSKPVTIADIGRYTRARTAQAINAPSDAQRSAIDFLSGRQAGQNQRLIGDVQENVLPNMPLGPEPLNVYSAAEDLAASRAGNADELKPRALYERQQVPPNVPVADVPPVATAPPLDVSMPAPTEEQLAMDLQPPAPPVPPPAPPPVRTVREAPTTGLGRTIERQAPVAPAQAAEPPDAGLLRLLGGAELRAPLPSGPAFAEAMNAPEQAAIAAEQQAAQQAAAEAAAARTARQARLKELQGMSAERRAAAEAADLKQAKEAAFFQNAQQQELDLPPGGRRRNVDQYGPPAPTYNERAPRMVNDPVLDRLFSEHPLAQRALEGAVRQSQSERAGKLILGQDTTDTPEILAGQPLDYRTADYLKRFLDKEVNNLYSRAGSDTFSAAQAEEVKNLRNTIRDRLKEGNPEYKHYLNTYADDSELMNALEAGKEFTAQPAEVIAKEQAARKPAAREMFQMGAARNLVDTIRGTADTGSASSRILNSDEARRQVEALGLPEGNTQALATAVGQEKQLNELQGMVKPKFMAPDAPGAMSRAGDIYNPGSLISVGRAVARGIADTILSTRNAKVNESIINKILTTDPATQSMVISQLEMAGNKKAADNVRRVLRARSYGVTSGFVLGSPVSLQEE